jgi:hypothetical protein
LKLDDVGLEDVAGRIEKMADLRVPQPVVHSGAGPAGIHQILHSKNRQLLRNGGTFSAQPELELADALLALAEKLQDPDSGRMGERFEELRLETLQLPRLDRLLIERIETTPYHMHIYLYLL